MKTLRSLLIEKHQGAATRLDGVRRNVMTDLAAAHGYAARPAQKPEGLRGLGSRYFWGFWMEVILPCRRFGWGVLAVWLLVALLHQASMSSDIMSDDQVMPPRSAPVDIIRLAREQRRELITSLEVLQPDQEEPVPAAPAQGPRSQRTWPGELIRG